jgi:hypothetical protein
MRDPWLDRIDQVYLAADQDKTYLQMQEELANASGELCRLLDQMTPEQSKAVDRYARSVIRLHRYLVALSCRESCGK